MYSKETQNFGILFLLKDRIKLGPHVGRQKFFMELSTNSTMAEFDPNCLTLFSLNIHFSEKGFI